MSMKSHLSGARVFLNGCRTHKLLDKALDKSGARVFLNGCRTASASVFL